MRPPLSPTRRRQLETALKLLAIFKVDFEPKHRQPTNGRLVLATIMSLIGSLAADAAIVAIGTAVFPATKGYVHFVFSDYAKLTIVGVIIACAGWPIVTRVSSAPRWVFLRSAILVTVVLFLPDLYLLVRGDSKKAVLVLMVMHVAIAFVTYNALVRLAPIKQSLSRHGARREALAREP
jgi:hypothetical protein